MSDIFTEAYALVIEKHRCLWREVSPDEPLDWSDQNLLAQFLLTDHLGVGLPFFSHLQLVAEESHVNGQCQILFSPFDERLLVVVTTDYIDEETIDRCLAFWPVGHKGSMITLNDFLLLIYEFLMLPPPPEIMIDYQFVDQEFRQVVAIHLDHTIIILYQEEEEESDLLDY